MHLVELGLLLSSRQIAGADLVFFLAQRLHLTVRAPEDRLLRVFAGIVVDELSRLFAINTGLDVLACCRHGGLAILFRLARVVVRSAIGIGTDLAVEAA